MQVNIGDARKQLSHLIELALAGETVIIAKRGVPVVRLVPIGQIGTEPKRGSVEAVLSYLDALDPARPRRSKEELDAELEAERASWD